MYKQYTWEESQMFLLDGWEVPIDSRTSQLNNPPIVPDRFPPQNMPWDPRAQPLRFFQVVKPCDPRACHSNCNRHCMFFWKPYPTDYLLSNFMNDYLSTSWYQYTSDVVVNLNFLSDSWDGTIGGWAQITIPTGDPELVPWDPRGISGLGHPASIGTLWEDSERSWDT
jgi:hypothetical protein